MAQRREHVKNLRPDKLIYGSIMMLVTGSIGILHAAVVLTFDVTYSGAVPRSSWAGPRA